MAIVLDTVQFLEFSSNTTFRKLELFPTSGVGGGSFQLILILCEILQALCFVLMIK
jgi:hypothetical protein